MVALVNDNLTVAFHERLDVVLVGERLHHGDIDLSAELGLAAADGADYALPDAQKGLQTLPPLFE